MDKEIRNKKLGNEIGTKKLEIKSFSLFGTGAKRGHKPAFPCAQTITDPADSHGFPVGTGTWAGGSANPIINH